MLIRLQSMIGNFKVFVKVIVTQLNRYIVCKRRLKTFKRKHSFR